MDMPIKYLSARIFKIYSYTILSGTLIDSIGIGIMSEHDGFMMFFAACIFGVITTSIICIPNFLALNIGLKKVYSRSRNHEEKKTNLLYLWIIICLIPTLFFYLSFGNLGGIYSVEDFLTLLLPVPYAIAALYFLFKVNNNYDEKYPHNFNINDSFHEDILDADL